MGRKKPTEETTEKSLENKGKHPRGGGPWELKLTPEVQTAIVESISAGNFAFRAACAAGVAPRSFYTWLKKGRSGVGSPYNEFYAAVKQAEAQAEDEAIKKISNAAFDNWQAAAWFLERRQPKRWGRRDMVAAEALAFEKAKYAEAKAEAKAAAERGGGSESTEIVITTRGAPATVSVSQDKPKAE